MGQEGRRFLMLAAPLKNYTQNENVFWRIELILENTEQGNNKGKFSVFAKRGILLAFFSLKKKKGRRVGEIVNFEACICWMSYTMCTCDFIRVGGDIFWKRVGEFWELAWKTNVFIVGGREIDGQWISPSKDDRLRNRSLHFGQWTD